MKCYNSVWSPELNFIRFRPELRVPLRTQQQLRLKRGALYPSILNMFEYESMVGGDALPKLKAHIAIFLYCVRGLALPKKSNLKSGCLPSLCYNVAPKTKCLFVWVITAGTVCCSSSLLSDGTIHERPPPGLGQHQPNFYTTEQGGEEQFCGIFSPNGTLQSLVIRDPTNTTQTLRRGNILFVAKI